MDSIKVVQIGMGPLGRKITQFIEERDGVEVVGAVDVSPDVHGRDLRAYCDLEGEGPLIEKSTADCLKRLKPEAVILTTVSSMEKITPQIEEIVSCGVPVVSTCEELAFPWTMSPDLSRRIDTAARENKVAVLGTGVNPGFIMDALAIFLTSVCQKVERIKVNRFQDASHRRIPFQKKIGAGLNPEQFEEKKKEGVLRHVGLTESIQLIASRMGWHLTRTEDILSPIISDKQVASDAVTVPMGHAAGVEQIGRGFAGDQEKITLHFRAAIGEPEPQDTIEIHGNPSFTSTIAGGLNGDIATCAIIINALREILKSDPGLKTMADIPLVSYFCQ